MSCRPRPLIRLLPLCALLAACDPDRQATAPWPERKAAPDWAALSAATAPGVYLLGLKRPGNAFEGPQVQLVGTGFAASAHILITNGHVARYLGQNDSLPAVAVRSGDPMDSAHMRVLSSYKFHPLYTGTATSADLAALRVADSLPFVLLRSPDSALDSMRIGDAIFTLGYPGETDPWQLDQANPSFKTGALTEILPADAGTRTVPRGLLQHSLDLTGGTSGSPILDGDGRVAAINNSGTGTSTGWAISARFLDTLLPDTGFLPLDRFPGLGAYRHSFSDLSPAKALSGTARVMVDSLGLGQFYPLDSLIRRWGNGYDTLRDATAGRDSSLAALTFTDSASFRLYALFRSLPTASAPWRLEAVLITDVPGQAVPNPFINADGNVIGEGATRIGVGSTKEAIQHDMGRCLDKTTADGLLYYHYRKQGISFVFRGAEDHSSAVLLYMTGINPMPHLDYWKAEMVTPFPGDPAGTAAAKVAAGGAPGH